MFSAALLSLASLISVNYVAVNDTAASDTGSDLTYAQALNCSAYLAMLSGANEADGNSERAALMMDDSVRWLMLAAFRDGEDGERAIREMPVTTDNMPALLEEAAAANEVSLEAAYVDLMQSCQGLQADNAEEFDTALDELEEADPVAE